MDRSEAELLEAARSGDAWALEELLEQSQPRVYRFGMRMCRDPEDARDVLQETLLAMARGVRDFRGASSLSTWLYTVARSFCIKKRRRQAPPVVSLDDEASPEAARLADPARGPEEAAASREVESALQKAIAALDPKLRETLLLRDAEGLSAAEVAEVLGLGVPAVKSRLHRARLAVRARMAPLLGIPSPQQGPSTCPDVLNLMSRHLEGDIDAATCTEMEKHVDACDRCRGACESLRRTLALCRTSPSPQVPSDVQDAVRSAIRSALA